MPLYTPNGTSDHDALINVSADDHHAQVHTVDGGDHTGTLAIGQIPTGTSGTTVALGDAAAGLITTHEAAGDPHPIYATEAEASAQIATHAGLADPHTGYRLESDDHSHASTGLQAGQVAHSALTTVTATDHHAAPVAGPDANIVVDAAGAAGTAGSFARSAHGHRVDTDAGVASTQAFGDAAIAGTSATIQRQGHKHAMPANPVTAHEAAGDPHTGYVREADASWIDLTDSGATTLHSHAGGGGFTATTVSVTLPYPARKQHVVNVVDAGVSAGSDILLSLRGVDETDVNASDTVDLLSLSALAKSGSFDVLASFLSPIAGPLKINYAIG